MKTYILLATLTFFCCNCNATKPVRTFSQSINAGKIISKNYGREISGSWQLKSSWGMEKAWVNKAFINIDFNKKIFSGNAGCNDISGTFLVKDDIILFDKNITIAKNECPGYSDKKFISMLLKINKMEVHEDMLELSQDNIVLMTFRKLAE